MSAGGPKVNFGKTVSEMRISAATWFKIVYETCTLEAMAKIEELRDHYDNTDVAELIDSAEETDFGNHVAPEAMSAFTVRLPTHVLNRVRAIAEQENCSTGAAMRAIIEQGVADSMSDDAVIPVRELRRLISSARGA